MRTRRFLFIISILSILSIPFIIFRSPPPNQPFPESFNVCSSLLRQALNRQTYLSPEEIAAIPITYSHHSRLHRMSRFSSYPWWSVTGTYTSYSGPFTFTCTAQDLPAPRNLKVALRHPVPWFIGTPVTNIQCLSIRNAPKTTLAYLAYQEESAAVAERRTLHHLPPCPEPVGSVTPEGN